MARFLVTGATGTIGRALIDDLRRRDHEVTALSRGPEAARGKLPEGVDVQRWEEPTGSRPPRSALSGADAVVHLLGEPIAQRWTESSKRAIHDSRVLSTRNLVAALGELPDGERPAVLVSQSATGYYGPTGDREVGEDAEAGSDFLAQVVIDWEREAHAAERFMRVVVTRTGVVLSSEGGALGQMLPFFRLGLGGPVAGGKQYVPWVHLDDVARGLEFCAAREEMSGPVNLTAPQPVTNADFSRALGRALGRPTVLPVPGFGLRLLFGEMAQVITEGACVVPKRLLTLGFEFSQPSIDRALRDLLSPR